ncbi:MAG: murein biosynthesis integral membrane protein MurJ [Thermodesulfobacteriota bacterium]|nr:murein biosynthesis integral membrane protein MurJ [Thermodesulfobacteriota bacterium]
MSENTRVTKAAGVVSSATLLSRIFGYIRDMVIAAIFGAGFYSDAFVAAFRIPNLIRRLFGEGSLSISFVPVFTQYITEKGKDEAFEMARSAIKLLSVLLVIITVAGIALSPWIVHIFAPGFTGSPEKYALTVVLTRIMFPYIFFICLVALSMGILNVLGHFAAPALAPVFLNIAMIVSVTAVSIASTDPANRVYGLAFGVVVGGCLQLALQVPFLIKNGFYFWQKTAIWHSGLKRIVKLFFPAIFGSAVYQINTLVITLLASIQSEGSVSYLYYADRLVQFPLGIFAIAAATALLPSISRQAAAKDMQAVRDSFAYTLKLVFFITIPAMVGLIVLRQPVVALLFQRGAFGGEATLLTAKAVLYYSIGLWAVSGVRIIVFTLYALKDTKTPVYTAAISIMANIILGVVLMEPMGHAGLALALSLASMLNFGLLMRSLNIKLGPLKQPGLAEFVCKNIICSVLMGTVVWTVALYIIPPGTESLSGLIIGLLGSILTGLVIYGGFSIIFKTLDIKTVLNLGLFKRQ